MLDTLSFLACYKRDILVLCLCCYIESWVEYRTYGSFTEVCVERKHNLDQSCAIAIYNVAVLMDQSCAIAIYNVAVLIDTHPRNWVTDHSKSCPLWITKLGWRLLRRHSWTCILWPLTLENGRWESFLPLSWLLWMHRSNSGNIFVNHSYQLKTISLITK